MKKMHIILDNRERKLMEIFDNKEEIITYESQQLDVADVVVSEEVAIERKEGNDFIGSIIDNRLFEQLTRLKNTYPKPIIILEGFNDEILENTGMRLSSIYGVLSKVTYDMEIYLIPTRNIDDTAILIERIAYREQIKKSSSVFSRKAPKKMTTEERRQFIIEGLVDIGAKKAETLITHFKTPYEVFKAIRDSRIVYTNTGNPKGIEGPLKSIKGFSWKFVKKNQKLLLGYDEKNLQKKIDEILK